MERTAATHKRVWHYAYLTPILILAGLSVGAGLLVSSASSAVPTALLVSVALLGREAALFSAMTMAASWLIHALLPLAPYPYTSRILYGFVSTIELGVKMLLSPIAFILLLSWTGLQKGMEAFMIKVFSEDGESLPGRDVICKRFPPTLALLAQGLLPEKATSIRDGFLITLVGLAAIQLFVQIPLILFHLVFSVLLPFLSQAIPMMTQALIACVRSPLWLSSSTLVQTGFEAAAALEPIVQARAGGAIVGGFLGWMSTEIVNEEPASKLPWAAALHEASAVHKAGKSL